MKKQPEVCERTKTNLLEAFWKVYNENTLYKIKPVLIIKFNLKENDLRIDVICEYCLGAILTSITYWYNNKNFSSEELATLLYELITNRVLLVLKDI